MCFRLFVENGKKGKKMGFTRGKMYAILAKYERTPMPGFPVTPAGCLV